MSILSIFCVLQYSSEAKKLEVNTTMLQPLLGWRWGWKAMFKLSMSKAVEFTLLDHTLLNLKNLISVLFQNVLHHRRTTTNM